MAPWRLRGRNYFPGKIQVFRADATRLYLELVGGRLRPAAVSPRTSRTMSNPPAPASTPVMLDCRRVGPEKRTRIAMNDGIQPRLLPTHTSAD